MREADAGQDTRRAIICPAGTSRLAEGHRGARLVCSRRECASSHLLRANQVLVRALAARSSGPARQITAARPLHSAGGGRLLAGLGPAAKRVESHGDTSTVAPPGFVGTAQTGRRPPPRSRNQSASVRVQFHPAGDAHEYGTRFAFLEGGRVPPDGTDVNIVGRQTRVSGSRSAAGVAICGLSCFVHSSVAASLVRISLPLLLLCFFLNASAPFLPLPLLTLPPFALISPGLAFPFFFSFSSSLFLWLPRVLFFFSLSLFLSSYFPRLSPHPWRMFGLLVASFIFCYPYFLFLFCFLPDLVWSYPLTSPYLFFFTSPSLLFSVSPSFFFSCFSPSPLVLFLSSFLLCFFLSSPPLFPCPRLTP